MQRARRTLFVARHYAATRAGKITLGLIIALVALRLAAPYVVKHVINERLAQLEGYRGRVEDVDLAIWRGAYQLDGMRIEKTGGDVPVPFFYADRIDISVEWLALFEGSVVAEIGLAHPILNFVTDASGGEGQMGEEADWRALVDDLVPITINRFEVHEGEVHYRDFGSRPQLDLRLTELEMVALGLSTTQDETSDELPARVDAYGTVQGSGALEAHVQLDPWRRSPTFDLDLALRRLDATEVDDMLRAYAGVDAESGALYLYSELSARDGRFEGYVKPMARGLSLFAIDEEGDFFDVLGDALVQLAVEVFENHGTDQFAVRVPLSGSLDSPDADGWSAAASVLYNAFVEAIQHGIEERSAWRPEIERRASR